MTYLLTYGHRVLIEMRAHLKRSDLNLKAYICLMVYRTSQNFSRFTLGSIRFVHLFPLFAIQSSLVGLGTRYCLLRKDQQTECGNVCWLTLCDCVAVQYSGGWGAWYRGIPRQLVWSAQRTHSTVHHNQYSYSRIHQASTLQCSDNSFLRKYENKSTRALP